MNYYIQGNKDKADQIKAAFEKLGYDVTGFDMCNDNILFFTYKLQTGANVISTTNAHLYTANIIKTHPDYQELELPVESKFKVGDRVVNDYCAGKVIALTDDAYLLDSGQGIPFSCEHNAHLWTIQDAKDGDVLVDTLSGTRALTILFISINEDDSISSYCGWNGYTFRVTIDGLGYGTLSSTRYVPATKEQRDLFFTKMREAGYQWDSEKKELRKIKPHYDISNFKPFDKVLVRQDNSCTWGASFFGRYGGMFMCCNNACFIQCIPYNDDTMHLLGTTDMCDEMYINW